MTTTNYNIIACDGGGIRGLITAMLLDDLVKNPPQGATTTHILENVNLFAGTSTGGIIAIGLACKLDPSSMVALYKNSCSTIFTPYSPSDASSVLSKVGIPQLFLDLDPCSWVPDLCHVEFTNKGLYSTLSSTLSTAKVDPNTPLSQLPNKVLVVTMKISDTSNDPWRPLALTNLPGTGYADIAVIDAAMCTSAAPIYFPPYAVPPAPATPTMWCADGGLVANNPSSFTLGNVLKSNVVEDLSTVRMLSLGTGVTIDYVPSVFLNGFENDWGMLMWLNPLPVPNQPKFPVLGATFDGQSQIADIETSNILGKQYMRANPTLPQTIDLADCTQIGTLETVAQDYINSDEWKSAKSWAYKNFV